MQEQYTLQILELLHTMQEACLELYDSAENGKTEQFQQLCWDGKTGLLSILKLISGEDSAGSKKLYLACRSILDTLRRVEGYYRSDLTYCLKKIEFEMLPLLQEAYFNFYFFQYLSDHPEHLNEFYKNEVQLLCGNSYIDDALKVGQYKYDVSIAITAYNKLEYTQQCVESLLSNLPPELNHELILINHGSNDGTKEYFESIQPDKQIDIAVNGGGASVLHRVVEGEFTIWISNDVIVTPHAIENLLACIRSSNQIAWAVPSTPNVSNFQTISAEYATRAELMEFAEKNNFQDPYRWEQRVRLCNPMDIRRSSIWYASNGLNLMSRFHTVHPVHALSFPDDRASLLLRRNGYQMMLVKDAYCHHFGSITLKDEIRKQNEEKYYIDGRKEFYRAFQVDPWGIGFCYDSIFMARVVGEHYTHHVEILGVNCGLGSNPLKIKEQVKEYCHNINVCLSNITNESRFLEDLKGTSNEVKQVQKYQDFKKFLVGKSFDYIVWEHPIFPLMKEAVLVNLQTCLRKGGRMFAKKDCIFYSDKTNWDKLGNDWFVYGKQ